MSADRLERLVIVGGGTAGWMTAALVSSVIPTQQCEVVLIEAPDLPTVGVGEATVPPLIGCNQILGIDERDFLRDTKGTIKLGIQFVDWGPPGHVYMHPFGGVGADLGKLQFHHCWARAAKEGSALPFDGYALNSIAAYRSRMVRARQPGASLPFTVSYAYHIDAGLYASMLRRVAEARGVRRVSAKVDRVNTDPESGFIRSVVLTDGTEVAGDLFVDCTGFRALLIEKTLGAHFERWDHWLPCDGAVVGWTSTPDLETPYTRATAHPAGWKWRIPLQDRISHGVVFSSRFTSDEAAKRELVERAEHPLDGDPRFIRFTTGNRPEPWTKNCIAIGLSSGFLEPLESTSIDLIQKSVLRLLRFFPDKQISEDLRDQFNREAMVDTIEVRDFLILHYKLCNRTDSEFWDYCREMEIPPELERRLRLFRKHGIVRIRAEALFGLASWTSVMCGMDLLPETHHPSVDQIPSELLESRLTTMRQQLEQAVEPMPTHAEFLAARG